MADVCKQQQGKHKVGKERDAGLVCHCTRWKELQASSTLRSCWHYTEVLVLWNHAAAMLQKPKRCAAAVLSAALHQWSLCAATASAVFQRHPSLPDILAITARWYPATHPSDSLQRCRTCRQQGRGQECRSAVLAIKGHTTAGQGASVASVQCHQANVDTASGTSSNTIQLAHIQ